MDQAIVIENLTFTYLHSDEPALRHINLTVPKHQVTAVVGPVGAGKTTLMLAMNGIIPEYIPGELRGKIQVEGLDVAKHKTEQLAETLNLLFDDPVLQIVGPTVEEDVAFGPANLGLPREEIWRRVAIALAKLRLEGYEKRNPQQLSGGEKQLLAMAGVFVMQSQVLVMDEPVAMLDPIGKRMVFDAIRETNSERGLTTVVTDSGADIEAVCEFADHMILLDHGMVIDEGKPQQVLANREKVEETTLRVPQVTRLFWETGLHDNIVPVNLDQALQDLNQEDIHLETKQIRNQKETNRPKAETTKPLVIAKNLHHTYPSYPPVKALKGVNLEIYPGELIALLGQNGSGKTTLALHLVGILDPTNDDADIQVCGLNVRETPMQALIQSINYVFQDPYQQLFKQTFGDEVAYGPNQLGLGSAEIEERVKASLSAVGLLDLREYYQAQLTRSEATLLGLAAVLALDPKVLIADEPTKGLDEPAGEKVMNVLKARCERGGAVLMVTHDMELAARHATRIIVMKDGNILIDDKPRTVFANAEILHQAYLAPPQITRLALEVGNSDTLPLTIDEFVQTFELRE